MIAQWMTYKEITTENLYLHYSGSMGQEKRRLLEKVVRKDKRKKKVCLSPSMSTIFDNDDMMVNIVSIINP